MRASPAELRFKILGPLEFERSGAPIDIGTFRQKSLLALLLINANRMISTDAILDELWGDDATGRQNALWVHVSNLRSTLEPDRKVRTEGTILLTRSPGYLLALDGGALDSADFELLVEEGRSLLSYDPSAAALVFAEALAIWRGRALQEFTYEPFAQAEIRRLEGMRLDAVEGRIEADLARGMSSHLIGELEALVHEHPLRERFTAQLMIALYRAGRRAEALRVFDALADRLRSELGVDPSHEVRGTLTQVLEGDPRLQPSPANVPRGPQPGLAVRGYELRSELGRSACMTVYRAYQPSVGREVAVKVIRSSLANDPEFIRRFESDTRLVSSIESSGLVPLYDFWREPEGAFLVEKLVGGGDLEEVASKGPLPSDRMLALIRSIATPLARAHERGVLHGNVRLDKVLLDLEGNPHLTDFGLTTDPISISTDIAGLALCAGQLLIGRTTARDDMIGELQPQFAEVVARALSQKGFSSVDELVEALGAAAGVSFDTNRVAQRTATNPYKGLEPFDQTDRDQFFGRERLVERMVSRLGGIGPRSRFLAVVGPSGCGKSSVVKAGLLPVLRDGAVAGSESWYAVTMTPGAQPFESLVHALAGIAVTMPPNLLEQIKIRPAGMSMAIDQVLPDPAVPLVLVIDQFEELYTSAREDECDAFIAGLVEAVSNDRCNLRVVITVRADYYDHPLSSVGLGELFRDHTELITPMTIPELEVAIGEPAAAVGVSVEPSLLVAMTADTLNETGALPMLQYTLTELFEGRRGATMTLDAYREMGGLGGAVVRRSEALFTALTPAARTVAQQVFSRLVSVNDMGEDTRRRVLLSELEGLAVGEGEVMDILRSFARHRLLTFDRDPISRAPTVELAHESLITTWSRLSDWVEGAREDLRSQRRLAAAAAEWASHQRDPDFLLTGASLARYAGWTTDPPLRLNADEQDFLDSAVILDEEREFAEMNRTRREAKLRARTRALAGLAVVSLIVILAAVLAYDQRRQAQDLATDLSERDSARELVVQSGLVAASDPELAMMLAVEAIRETEQRGEALPEAVDALHWALQEATIEYPADDTGIPVAVRPHAGGPRGVFLMPPSDLVDHAQTAITRGFTTPECDRYFTSRACPQPTLPVARDLTVAGGMRRYGGIAPPGRPLEGTSVLLTGSWGGDMVTSAEADLADLGSDSGVQVVYRPFRPDENLDDGVSGEETSDLIAAAGPGLIFDTAAVRSIVNVGAYLGENDLADSYGDHLVQLVSQDGSIYGLPIAISPKSLIWYNPEAFRRAGYAVPSSWSELIALSDQMVEDGNTPWCLGVFSFDATGWPATDWLETILLQSEGPAFYDKWATHEIPFDDPAVVAALEKVGQLAHTQGYQLPRKIEETSWDEALFLASQDPPRCWMAPFPDFGPNFFGPAPMTFMVFPSSRPEYSAAMEGGTNIVFAISDRPEVRAVMRQLATRSWGSEMAQQPTGWFYPSNIDFDASLFTDPLRRALATSISQANKAGLFRFDASDQMPLAIGFDVLNPALTEYLSSTEVSARATLRRVEDAWSVIDADRGGD